MGGILRRLYACLFYAPSQISRGSPESHRIISVSRTGDVTDSVLSR